METHNLEFYYNNAKMTATVSQLNKLEKITKLTIPRYVTKFRKKYTVTAIGANAFKNANIDTLNFEDDTEVISFEPKSFYSASISNLQIPASIQKLEPSWCEKLNQVNIIDLSPKNKNFKLVNKKFLVSKSQEYDSDFDSLLYICNQGENRITIPQQIQILRQFSLDGFEYLNTLIFTEDSKLKIIEQYTLPATLENIILPANLEFIHPTNWNKCNLSSIKIPSENKSYQLINDKYFCMKSEGSLVFDTIVFAPRNIENIIIPSHIKYISDYAFANCKYVTEFSFEPNSSLEKIGSYALSNVQGLDSIQIPSEKITFLNNAFSDSSLKKFYFPNAKIIRFDENSSKKIEDAELIIHKDAKIIGYDHAKFLKKPIYYEDLEKKHHHKIDEFDKILNFDEMQLETHEMISRSSNSISYKIYDNKYFINIYKKVIKTSEISEEIIRKEIKEIKTIEHPCLCKIIDIEMKKVKKSKNTMKINIYNEFLSYNLNDCIINNTLNNTLKVKIALEVAFGILFLHRKEIILKNLDASKIMLNPIFEAKIINYGLPSFASDNVDDMNSLIYKSPELYTSNKFNRQTDIYSYGIVLHFLFSDKLPVQTLNEKDKRKEINIDQSLFTGSCFDLIKKCLSTNPSRRYSSFNDIIKYMKEKNFLLAENVDVRFILNRYRYIKSFQCCLPKE